MINKIVDNVWWKFIIGLLAIFGFFGIRSDSFVAFFSNTPWFNVIILSLLWGAFIFGIHSYLRAERNRKDNIILTARLDGQFKKIDSQFEAVGEALKIHQQCVSHTMDSIEKTQDDFNKRFEWLYNQITNDKDST